MNKEKELAFKYYDTILDKLFGALGIENKNPVRKNKYLSIWKRRRMIKNRKR
ncbi:MAG: hypothetical protein LBF97_03655 [Elusimicrobiota bacterium]|jgi:hypothetical protein|nr:hypothetical protein [Elusimicrobiota bacterium]